LAYAGRNLGGSTNINGLINTRGSPQVFDAWGQITGDGIWKYENVLPFFKKGEDYHGYYQNPLSKWIDCDVLKNISGK